MPDASAASCSMQRRRAAPREHRRQPATRDERRRHVGGERRHEAAREQRHLQTARGQVEAPDREPREHERHPHDGRVRARQEEVRQSARPVHRQPELGPDHDLGPASTRPAAPATATISARPASRGRRPPQERQRQDEVRRVEAQDQRDRRPQQVEQARDREEQHGSHQDPRARLERRHADQRGAAPRDERERDARDQGEQDRGPAVHQREPPLAGREVVRRHAHVRREHPQDRQAARQVHPGDAVSRRQEQVGVPPPEPARRRREAREGQFGRGCGHGRILPPGALRACGTHRTRRHPTGPRDDVRPAPRPSTAHDVRTGLW